MVDPNSEKENVHIRVHGTGHNVPDSDRLEYIGTFQNVWWFACVPRFQSIVMNDDRHCSECKHFWSNPKVGQMY